MADDVLPTVGETVRNVIAAIQQGNIDYDHLKNKLRSCIDNVNRIGATLDEQSRQELVKSIQDIVNHVEEKRKDAEPTETQLSFALPRIPPPKGSKGGKPKIEVSAEQFKFMRDEGYTAKDMSKQLECSASFVYKKLSSLGLQLRSKYSTMTNQELETEVQSLHADFPNAGHQMMKAYLHANGSVVQRSRVRSALNRIDPPAVAKRWSKTVKRRTYRVPTPNSLWHMDGHMKLTRWKLVTHGCIDGYSRCITFLKCGQENSSITVLTHFVQATIQYGLPSRTRSDHGGENFLVALFMDLVQGPNRVSHLTGESKHNQRIERLWKDVFVQVISYFHELFYHFEDTDQLDPENQVHITALHQVFLIEINRRLSLFRDAWNKHSVRTERHQTPNQLWVSGMLEHINTDTRAVNHVFNGDDVRSDLVKGLRHYGLDLDSFGDMNDQTINIPEAAQVNPPVIGTSDERVAELVRQCSSTTDLTERYIQLRELLSADN